MEKIYKKPIIITAIFIFTLILSGTASAEDLEQNLTEPYLCVEFNNDTNNTICVEKRNSTAAVDHFDVYGPKANATAAKLYLENGTIVNWGQQGREKSDLTNCPFGDSGYWHFVYTPAGVLALSSSECVEGTGVPTYLNLTDVRACPNTNITLSACLFYLDGDTWKPLPNKTVNFCIVINTDLQNPECLEYTATTGSDGCATITIPPLPKCPFSGPNECRYSILAWFAGDDTYKYSENTSNLLVKRFDTEIAVVNVSGNQNQNVTLQATLTNKEDGTPLEGRTVTFYVDGKEVGSDTTDEYGIATLLYNIKQTQGKYIVTAKFNNTGCYNGSEGQGELNVEYSAAKIVVNNVTICPLGKPIISAKLTDNEGNPLAGRTIKFSINPEAEAVTNSEGIATTIFNPLPLGSYTITALFESDGEFAEVSAQAPLNVVEDYFPTMLKMDNIKGAKGEIVALQAILTNNQGVTLEGHIVKFYVGGIYAGSAITNAAGIATLPYTITQNPGTYTVKAVFDGFECYNPSVEEAYLHVTGTVEAATVSMQTTGLPISALILAIMAVLGGLIVSKRK